MRIDGDMFDTLMLGLMYMENAVYDDNARLLCGGKGTPYPAFTERAGSMHSSYILYATVGGRTLPLAHGMNSSLIDQSRAMEPPKGTNMPCAYASGLAYHFDKPLEVLALETPSEEGIKPKWDIWMLRDMGEDDGYLNDSVARALSRR
jgi:hypothetical protein